MLSPTLAKEIAMRIGGGDVEQFSACWLKRLIQDGQIETSVALGVRSVCGRSPALGTLSPRAEDAAILESSWSLLIQIRYFWSPGNCRGGRRSSQGSSSRRLYSF